MHRLLHVSLAAAALVAAASAQSTYLGFSYNVQVGATSRGSLGTAAGTSFGEVMTVIKGEEYAGWGYSGLPGTRTINSILLIIQDQDAIATAEVFDVLLYPESLATPGTPDLTQGVVFATGVTGPAAPATGTISAAVKTVTPAAPVSVPIVGTGDIFVSFRLPAAVSTADYLSVQINLGYAPSTAFTIFDIPGSNQQPGPTPATVDNTHGMSRLQNNATVVLNGRRSHLIDVAHTGPGAMALTITNQVSYVGSNNPPPAGYDPAPGTASMMSGCAPDVTGFTAGRADDITFEYFRTGSAGNPLIFYVDFGAFPAVELPLGFIFPGATGNICMNSTFFDVSTQIIGATNEAWNTIVFPAAVRPLAAGLSIIHQALELNVLGGNLILSPASRQRL